MRADTSGLTSSKKFRPSLQPTAATVLRRTTYSTRYKAAAGECRTAFTPQRASARATADRGSTSGDVVRVMRCTPGPGVSARKRRKPRGMTPGLVVRAVALVRGRLVVARRVVRCQAAPHGRGGTAARSLQPLT